GRMTGKPAGRPPRWSRTRARSFEVESTSRSRSLVEHDLFGKPGSTFPDHALQRLRHWPGRALGERELRNVAETMDQAGIGAERLLPIMAFGQDHAGADDLGA